jgi:hypothetical protein
MCADAGIKQARPAAPPHLYICFPDIFVPLPFMD